MFLSYQIIFLILALFAFAIPVSLWTYYISPLEDSKRKEDRKHASLILIKRVLVLGPLLFSVFLAWFFLQTIIWDYTLILAISEISVICILASEPRFWTLLNKDK